MSKALIVVDVQGDFLPGGKLAVPNGNEIIDDVVAMTKDPAYDYVIATMDWHPPDHVSFAIGHEPEFVDGSWPPHCVQGTPGSRIIDEVRTQASVVDGRRLIVYKGNKRDEEAYSGFDGLLLGANGQPTLEGFLRDHDVTEVDVVGLATDYCVKATAIDAAEKGFQTRVVVGATRPVTSITGAQACEAMREKGVTVE